MYCLRDNNVLLPNFLCNVLLRFIIIIKLYIIFKLYEESNNKIKRENGICNQPRYVNIYCIIF